MFFSLERGVRQGCPLSPYIFILCAEILVNAIRKDKKIKGININGTECNISQYADDTTLFLDGSEKSLQASLDILDCFSKISGLKINNTKTEAMWIGSSRNNTVITLLPYRKLKWVTSSVKALGVFFSTNEEQSIKQNTKERVDKSKKLTENWSLRRLTLFGKVTVIKAFLASQLVYVLTPLRTCKKTLKDFNVWDGKGDKIKRTVMINHYKDGGAKMLNIFAFNRALKATWITKYLDNNNKGK